MGPMATHASALWRLVAHCGDRPGINAAVFSYLARCGANIVQADQHVTRDDAPGEEPRYFLRAEIAVAGIDAPLDEVARGFEETVAGPLDMEWHLVDAGSRPRVAVLVSRAEHCLLELLWRWSRGYLPIEIPVVVSNHDVLRDQVEAFGIRYEHLPVTPETRPEQERAIHEALGDDIDLVVLARYMQVLSREFLARYPQRVINIHHSFLPAFPGAAPYRQAFERGVKVIGATAHYAAEELDAGPIIEQDVARVTHRDLYPDLVRIGREVERSVLARAVGWHVEGRVFVHGRRVIVLR